MKLLLFLLVFSSSISAQNIHPTDYFRSPLDIPMQLSGNFGELRPNHFHAGFDLKTNKMEGLNVYAVADGYISRVKISTSGYGKCVYITHPNGYVSVYGHLQKAVGEIQSTIITEQYNAKEYEVEFFPKASDLPVKKGEIIGLSGNTGGSEGPHLHFEIRNSFTEKVINPMYFGFNLKDTKAPNVGGLFVYPIDENAVINESKRPVILGLTLQKDGTYVSDRVAATGKIGFGVNSFDTDDISFNNNGVFRTQLLSNGKLVFGYQFDEMDFNEARAINAFVDYPRYKSSKQRVQKLFMKYPYEWSNAYKNEDNGIFDVQDNFDQTQLLEVSDFNNNKTIITIPIEYSAKPSLISSDIKKTKYYIKAKNDASFEKENGSAFFPSGTFYDDFFMNFDVKNNAVFVHDDTVAVRSNFTIAIEDKTTTADAKKKMFIALVQGKKMQYISTKLNGNVFSCRTKSLGQFVLAKDITKPKITIPKANQGKVGTNKTIDFYISDDLSGINNYNGYLNGKWILFEYEPKLKKITYVMNQNDVIVGENVLKVSVSDNVGNSTIFEAKFFKK